MSCHGGVRGVVDGESVEDGVHLVLVASGLQDVLDGLFVEAEAVEEFDDAGLLGVLLDLVVLQFPFKAFETLYEFVD